LQKFSYSALFKKKDQIVIRFYIKGRSFLIWCRNISLWLRNTYFSSTVFCNMCSWSIWFELGRKESTTLLCWFSNRPIASTKYYFLYTLKIARFPASLVSLSAMTLCPVYSQFYLKLSLLFQSFLSTCFVYSLWNPLFFNLILAAYFFVESSTLFSTSL
jgi:hypothetical protein